MSGVASADPATPDDPSGNNGSIKVDGIDYDDTPANEPHVGCSFQIDFFGFDLGDRADIRFFAQPPSGDGQLLHEDLAVLVSDDAAAGGPNDVDERVTYDVSGWDLSALAPSAQQGYHVKVTADVIGAPGAGKQKVFWIDCPPVVTVLDKPIVPILDKPIVPILDEPIVPVVEKPIVPILVEPVVPMVETVVPVQPVVVSPVTTPVVNFVVAAEGPKAPMSSVESQRTPPKSNVEAQVLGASFSQGDTLPRTGVDSGLLAVVGISVMAVGTVLTRLGRVPCPRANA